MSGDLPIRKARTKREKNKSYNDSRNKFRASLKPERTDNSTSEEDEKIKEKKMKVDGQGEDIGQTIHNSSEEKEKQLKAAKEVDEKLTETATNEQKDNKDGQFCDKETGETKNSEEIAMAKTITKATEHCNEAQGSSNSNIIEEKRTADKVNINKGTDEFATWDNMFDSDEDGKAIHAKDSKKYVKVGISTPPAKTTSEEENTDDEEKDEDSDVIEKKINKSNNDDKDKDNEGSGGGTSTFKSEKDADGSGAAGGDETGEKDGSDMSVGDNTGGAGGNATDCVDEGQNNETEDDEEPPDDNDEESSDELMEGGDYSTGELNLEGAVDPYDFTDEEVDEDSANDYDRYEFLSQDGGSDHGSDFSFGGDFHDDEYHGGEFYEEASTTEVRGAG